MHIPSLISVGQLESVIIFVVKSQLEDVENDLRDLNLRDGGK